MSSLAMWYFFGLLSWIFLLAECKCFSFKNICLGALLGITGFMSPIIFVMLKQQGVFNTK